MSPSLPVKPSIRPPLVAWLFLGVLGATLSAVFACMLIMDRFMHEGARGDATRFLQTNADALRDALDRGMAQNYEQIRVLGQLDQVTDSQDPEAVRRALEQLHASFPHFAWLGVAGLDGRVAAATGGLLQGVDVSARPWFAGARHGTYVGDVHNAVLLAKVLPAQSEPWRFVDIATPLIGPDGSFRGILGCHMSWAWAGQIKRELVDTTLARHEAEAMIVGTDGTVLLGPAALQGRKLPVPADDELRVESRTRGSGHYPGLGWNVVLRQPESVAMAAYRALQLRTHAAAALLCLLLAPLLWLLARRVALPLRELAAQLAAREGERTPARRDPLYREVEQLGQALDGYARRVREDGDHLRELNANLEARVADRTETLARSEQRLRTITDNLPVLISYIDKDERYQFCNGTYGSWMGVDPRRMVGQTMVDLLGGTEYAKRTSWLRRALAGERVDFDLESTWMGVHRHLHSTYVPDVGPDGRVDGAYVLVSDVSATRQAEAKLALQARSDAVTGLNNRHAFNEKFAEALARSRRSGQPVAVLFLDVDKFKAINDTLGHACGDAVLRMFAQRLLAAVRETDTVARLSGDEFVVVLENLHTPAEPQFVARKILGAMARPFELDGRSLAITTSIGVAYQDDALRSPGELLALADKALYEAKAGGRNTFRMAAA